MELWELVTKLRKEADRFEEALSEAGGDSSQVESQYYIVEIESHLEDIKEFIENQNKGEE